MWKELVGSVLIERLGWEWDRIIEILSNHKTIRGMLSNGEGYIKLSVIER